MDYLITVLYSDGAEKNELEFKFSSNEKLHLATLITNDAVVQEALKHLPAGTSVGDVQSFSFTHLRGYLVSPVNF